MDLAGLINDGVEALHRGSVDKKGVQYPQTTQIKAASRHRKGIPPWAGIYRGSKNKVRDVSRWKLAETRPELACIFSQAEDDEEPEEKAGEHTGELGHSNKLPRTMFSNLQMPPPSVSEIGPGGNSSLTGLCASLAGMVPNDDQTQFLSGWVYERIQKLTGDRVLDTLEIEFKVGLISDEHSGLRHRFPVLSEAVIDPIYYQQQHLHFKSEIDVSAFKALENLLDSLIMANAGSKDNSLERENVLIRDEMHTVKSESKGCARVRVSYDDKEHIIECISKKRIGDLYISMPNSAYDLKMSLSLEEPVDYDEIAPQIKGAKPRLERNKNRLKWKAPGCVVDLTSVHGPAGQHGSVVTKEAEIEVNGGLLSLILHECRESNDNGTALDKFLEIMRYTMDTARFLVRRI